MTKKELYEMSFEDAVSELVTEANYITSYDNLKNYASDCINEDNIFLAIHVLEAINKNDAYYYDYDYSMGTLENPTPLNCLEDLEQYCEEE